MCILHLILKFKLHMYNRIEDFMLTIGWWQNYQSQSKKFRSDERVYNLKEYVRCGVLARIGPLSPPPPPSPLSSKSIYSVSNCK